MLDLYYWTTPNNHKITIFLEEAGLEYRIVPVDLRKREQHSNPELAKISANKRVPALIDPQPKGGASPVSVFESGAILQYLAEKTGKFLSTEPGPRAEVMQWLFWQMSALGPMSGQRDHFVYDVEQKIEYAIQRYHNEVKKLYGVLNTRLADRRFLAGDYSIADMACFPWVARYERLGQTLTDQPHLSRWLDEIALRPAVKRAYERAPKTNPDGPAIRTVAERAIIRGEAPSIVEKAEKAGAEAPPA